MDRSEKPTTPPTTVAEFYPDGTVVVTTSDPKTAALFSRMLEDPLCEWSDAGREAGEDGVVKSSFSGSAELMKPRLRKKPAPANGFKKGNPGRWGMKQPAAAPQPDPAPHPKAVGREWRPSVDSGDLDF